MNVLTLNWPVYSVGWGLELTERFSVLGKAVDIHRDNYLKQDPMQKIIKRRCISESRLQTTGLPEILHRIYTMRGVEHPGQLEYSLKNLEALTLKGLPQAVALLTYAIVNRQSILVIGDFDADGATSTALAVKCLRAFGHDKIDFLVPNRFEFGYGLTPEIVEVAAQRSPQLLLTVDNGISSVEGVERAHSLGIKVLITDHHLPGARLPAADAIVNPNQAGCTFASKAAAGVAVVFYVMMALRGGLRQGGWFNETRPEPNLADYLDLVALGTVADVVPLDYNNRILVDQGIRRMRAGFACAGIKAILTVAGRSYTNLSAQDLGFVVGPRLNAAGRLDDMSLGIRCLLADTEPEALAIAAELDDLNRERRSIEASMQKEAAVFMETLLDSSASELPGGLCLYREDWHQGVIGILASRIKDRYHRPVFVFADDGQGTLKGSGRSVAGIHLRDVLDEIATQSPGLLHKFGGHAMAAGMSLAAENLEAFKQAFAETVLKHAGVNGLQAIIESDGELPATAMDLLLAEQLQAGGPWGQGFPEPVFDGTFWVISQKLVGSKHLKMVLAPLEQRNQLVDAIAFNINSAVWPDSTHQKIRVAYKLAVNEFRGNRNLQLMVDYFEPA